MILLLSGGDIMLSLIKRSYGIFSFIAENKMKMLLKCMILDMGNIVNTFSC